MQIYEGVFVCLIWIYTCLLTEGIVYLWCYLDSANRVLPTQLLDSNTNTPAECARRCSDYRYAGVELAVQCFCGNSLHASPQPPSDCNINCPGDKMKICGGAWRISVFTNWACGPPPAIANGNATLRKVANLTYGSIADVYCSPGFISTPTITCLSNTSWEKAACEQPGTTSIPLTSLSNTTAKGQTSGTIHTTRETAPTTDSSSTTDNQSDASNQEASQRGSTTTVIAAGVSVAGTLAVAAVVIVLVLWKKQVFPCSKTTATSNIGKHTFENGPEQSYDDLVDRNESNTNYCELDINIESAGDNACYYNIERGQNHESETNDNCNPEYYNNNVALENV